MNDHLRFAVIIPCRDEAENLVELLPEILQILGGERFEVVIVDDGGSDNTLQVTQRLADHYPVVRYVAHSKGRGKSAAILTGVGFTNAPLIVTMDGDGQNDPQDVVPLLALLEEQGVGLAAGQRVTYAHSAIKRFSSRFANRLRASLLNDGSRDSACGLKVFRREVFLRLPLFNGMHRFLPALIKREGLTVRYMDVKDRSRRHGISKYGVIDRAVAGLFDLVRVWWMLRKSARTGSNTRK